MEHRGPVNLVRQGYRISSKLIVIVTLNLFQHDDLTSRTAQMR